VTAAVTDSSVLVESLVVEWLAPLMYTHKAALVSRLRSSPAVLCRSVACRLSDSTRPRFSAWFPLRLACVGVASDQYNGTHSSSM